MYKVTESAVTCVSLHVLFNIFGSQKSKELTFDPGSVLLDVSRLYITCIVKIADRNQFLAFVVFYFSTNTQKKTFFV